MASIIGVETLQHTNGTTAATIDSSGRIEMPQMQIAFQTARVQNFSVTTGGTYTYVGSATFDIGSNYNSTNGRFTAPFDGVYQFHGIVSTSGAVSGPQIYFYKNGTTSIDDSTSYGYGTAYQSATSIVLAELSANDYVTFVLADGNSVSPSIGSINWGGYLLFKT